MNIYDDPLYSGRQQSLFNIRAYMVGNIETEIKINIYGPRNYRPSDINCYLIAYPCVDPDIAYADIYDECQSTIIENALITNIFGKTKTEIAYEQGWSLADTDSDLFRQHLGRYAIFSLAAVLGAIINDITMFTTFQIEQFIKDYTAQYVPYYKEEAAKEGVDFITGRKLPHA